ncbi:hypothetical protein ABW19_dt0203449 [Dactylella cylindrospora]|nr:hypothetical protein ABW19_dt0203449 [Dactylella cylindrospora]
MAMSNEPPDLTQEEQDLAKHLEIPGFCPEQMSLFNGYTDLLSRLNIISDIKGTYPNYQLNDGTRRTGNKELLNSLLYITRLFVRDDEVVAAAPLSVTKDEISVAVFVGKEEDTISKAERSDAGRGKIQNAEGHAPTESPEDDAGFSQRLSAYKDWISIKEKKAIDQSSLSNPVRHFLEGRDYSFETHVETICQLLNNAFGKEMDPDASREVREGAWTQLSRYAVLACTPKLFNSIIHGIDDRNFWKYLGIAPTEDHLLGKRDLPARAVRDVEQLPLLLELGYIGDSANIPGDIKDIYQTVFPEDAPFNVDDESGVRQFDKLLRYCLFEVAEALRWLDLLLYKMKKTKEPSTISPEEVISHCDRTIVMLRNLSCITRSETCQRYLRLIRDKFKLKSAAHGPVPEENLPPASFLDRSVFSSLKPTISEELALSMKSESGIQAAKLDPVLEREPSIQDTLAQGWVNAALRWLMSITSVVDAAGNLEKYKTKPLTHLISNLNVTVVEASAVGLTPTAATARQVLLHAGYDRRRPIHKWLSLKADACQLLGFGERAILKPDAIPSFDGTIHCEAVIMSLYLLLTTIHTVREYPVIDFGGLERI